MADIMTITTIKKMNLNDCVEIFPQYGKTNCGVIAGDRWPMRDPKF